MTQGNKFPILAKKENKPGVRVLGLGGIYLGNEKGRGNKLFGSD